MWSDVEIATVLFGGVVSLLHLSHCDYVWEFLVVLARPNHCPPITLLLTTEGYPYGCFGARGNKNADVNFHAMGQCRIAELFEQF